MIPRRSEDLSLPNYPSFPGAIPGKLPLEGRTPPPSRRSLRLDRTTIPTFITPGTSSPTMMDCKSFGADIRSVPVSGFSGCKSTIAWPVRRMDEPHSAASHCFCKGPSRISRFRRLPLLSASVHWRAPGMWRTPSACGLWRARGAAATLLHDLCALGSGCLDENSHRGGVEFHYRTADHAQYEFAACLRRISRISSPGHRGRQCHSATDLFRCRGLFGRGSADSSTEGSASGHGGFRCKSASRDELHPCFAWRSASNKAESLSVLRRLLLACRKQCQLQRFAGGRNQAHDPRTAIPGELYVGQEPGHRLCSDGCHFPK